MQVPLHGVPDSFHHICFLVLLVQHFDDLDQLLRIGGLGLLLQVEPPLGLLVDLLHVDLLREVLDLAVAGHRGLALVEFGGCPSIFLLELPQVLLEASVNFLLHLQLFGVGGGAGALGLVRVGRGRRIEVLHVLLELVVVHLLIEVLSLLSLQKILLNLLERVLEVRDLVIVHLEYLAVVGVNRATQVFRLNLLVLLVLQLLLVKLAVGVVLRRVEVSALREIFLRGVLQLDQLIVRLFADHELIAHARLYDVFLAQRTRRDVSDSRQLIELRLVLFLSELAAGGLPPRLQRGRVALRIEVVVDLEGIQDFVLDLLVVLVIVPFLRFLHAFRKRVMMGDVVGGGRARFFLLFAQHRIG